MLINPGSFGCHSFEATDFLLAKRPLDPHGHVIFWQIGIIGELNHPQEGQSNTGIGMFVERLLEFYPEEHSVTVYEAAQP